MSALFLDDAIVHYEVLGRGKPVLFLHGWVGSWRYWIPSMQSLSTAYRTYALDFWGFGDSAKRADRYALGNQIDLIEHFLDRMGIMKLALVGHGLGALIAAHYALKRPEAIDRIMVVNCPLHGGLVNSRLQTSSPTDLAAWLLGKTATTDNPVFADVQKTDPAFAGIFMDSLKTVTPEVLHMLIPPCLMVFGQNDPLVQTPTPDDMAGFPDTAHYIELEQTGHFPMFDESSKFNRLLIDFLALPSGENPSQLQLKEEWKRRIR